MSTPALGRNGESAPSLNGNVTNEAPEAKEIGPTLVNGTKRSDNGQKMGSGYTTKEQTTSNGTHVKKQHKHKARRPSAPRLSVPAVKTAD